MTSSNEVLFDRISVCSIQRYWWTGELIPGFWRLLRHFLAPNPGQAWFRTESGQWISAEEDNWKVLEEHLLKAESVWESAASDDLESSTLLEEKGRCALFLDAERFRACVEDGDNVPGNYYVGFDAKWCWNPEASNIFTPFLRISNCWPAFQDWAPPGQACEAPELLSANQAADILLGDYWVAVEDSFQTVVIAAGIRSAHIDLGDGPQQPPLFYYASPTERSDNADLYLTGKYIRPLDILAQKLLKSPDIRSMEITGGVMEGCLAVFNHSPKVQDDFCLMIPLAGFDEDVIEKQLQFITHGWQDLDFDATWEIHGINKKLKTDENFFRLWSGSLSSASRMNETLFSLLGQDVIQERMFALTRLLSGFLAKLQARTFAGAMKRKQIQREMEWTIRTSKSRAQRRFTIRKISGLDMIGHISDGYTRVFIKYEEMIGRGANEAEKLSEQIENIGKSLNHTAELEQHKRGETRGRLLEQEEKASKLLNRVLALVAVLAAIPLLVGEYDTSSLSSAFQWVRFKMDLPFSFWSFGLQFTFWTALVTFGLTIWALLKTLRRESVADPDQEGWVAKVDDLTKALFDGYRGHEHPELEQAIYTDFDLESPEVEEARNIVNKFDLKLAYAVASALDQCTEWEDDGPIPENDEAWAEYMERKVCSFVLLSDVYDLRPEMIYLPVTIGLYRFMYAAGRLSNPPVSDHEFERVMGRYGYSDEEIQNIYAWGQDADHTQSTAKQFVDAYVEAGINALHKVDFSTADEV